jgi:phosphohistidine phosphatase
VRAQRGTQPDKVQIYLLRHAIASARRPGDTEEHDRGRGLTRDGARLARAGVAGLAVLLGKPDRLLSSPYRRALQTAVLAARALGLRRSDVAVLQALAGDVAGGRLLEALSRLPGRRLLCVGHEPQLSSLVALLCTAGRPLALDLRKAGLVRIDAERPLRLGGGQLRWLLSPRLLRRLGQD